MHLAKRTPVKYLTRLFPWIFSPRTAVPKGSRGGSLADTCVIRNACVGRGKTSPDQDEEPVAASHDLIGDTMRKHLFNRVSILRSVAFRMGFTFWLLFTVCFGVAEYSFYKALETRAMESIDDSIAERFDQVQDVYYSRGIEAVIDLAEARSSSPMTSSMGFHLSTIDGERVAGNVPICLTEPGWNNLLGEDLGLVGDESLYRFYTNSIGGNILSLGRSLDDLVELRQVALSCLIWTAIISTLLGIVAAWFFARRVHHRVSGISVALDGVAAGNLNARLPVTCARDDIDEFALKINSSLDRLKHTVDGMRQVSTDIAHDLKTPLNRLFITMEDAARKSRSGLCVGDELDGALGEAQAINGTFEALLRIAQIEAGARKSQFKHFDLCHVLETSAEVYTPVVEEQSQTLHLKLLEGQSLPVHGDKNLILQLVVNLIENAIHHCPEGTQISISAGRDKQTAWLCVSDTGLGIPEAERLKVFQRLYRLERSRTTRGTGLGLSLVKAITDLHNGSVQLVDNKPGLAVMVRLQADGAAAL